jgi:hypothetical protein
VQPAPPKKFKKQAPRVPNYLSGDWAKKFIPSVTHALLVSLEPFKDYKVSSPVFIATLQETFFSVYPDINHKITSSDVIAIVVCHQIYHLKPLKLSFARHMTVLLQRSPRLRELLSKTSRHFSTPMSSRTILTVSNHTPNGRFGKMVLLILKSQPRESARFCQGIPATLCV